VQNIGAYGIEIGDRVVAVEAVDERGRVAEIASRDCGFAYRASRFQSTTELCISHVQLRLNKTPNVNTTYADLAEELARTDIKHPAPVDVFDAVVRIRSSKLPDPQQVPNVGSFFKNPLIGSERLQALRAQFPDLKAFESAHRTLKLSAAQLIDLAGWKTRQDGPVRCWHLQPLVLTNVERVDASTVLAFAEAIRRDVKAKFGIYLELEPSVFS
jgi:UDP-N-acetylmuramate dehydrogenase